MLIISTDPYARLASLIGGRPQVQLHGDDLPSTYSFSSWPGRKGSVDGVGVGSPLSARNGWAGRGLASARTAHFRPASQFVTFNAEASNYAVNTPFTWYAAARIQGTAAQRNVLFLGSSSSGTRFRGLYLDGSSNASMISYRDGNGPESDVGSAFAVNEQVILGCSLDAAGNLLIKQLRASGESTLLSTTHAVTNTLTVDRFSLGTAILTNASSSPSPMWTRYLGCLRGVANDSATMTRAMRHIRDRLGCPLPATETYASKLISIPSGPARWYNGSLQTSALPVVDDQTGVDNAQANTTTLVSKSFDFLDNAAASITGTGMIIPAGSSPFTLIATVRRVAGRSWSTGINYNLISNVDLTLTTIINAGLLKYHVNGVLYSSGYDVVGTWTAGQRHVVALTYDGSDLRSYVDGALIATHAGVGSRSLPAEMHLGTFSGAAGGWMHRAKDFSIYTRALSGAELIDYSKAIALHSYDIIGEGDSNLALPSDGYSPAADSGLWVQSSRCVFPRAGWRTSFQSNLSASGRMIDTAGGIATSATTNAATVDAAADAIKWTLLLLNIGTNDIHQALYGGNVATVLSTLETYLDARIATGKYVGIVACELPPSSNATFDGKITTFNAGLATLKAAGKLKGVLARPFSDPSDTLNLLVENSTNDAKHWASPANKLRAEALITTLRDQVPWHD